MAVYLGSNRVSMVGGQPAASGVFYSGTLNVETVPDADVQIPCAGANHFIIWMPSGADLETGKPFFSSIIADETVVQFAYSTRAGNNTSQTTWYATGSASGETSVGVAFTETGVTLKFIPDSASSSAKQYFRWFQINSYDWVAWAE